MNLGEGTLQRVLGGRRSARAHIGFGSTQAGGWRERNLRCTRTRAKTKPSAAVHVAEVMCGKKKCVTSWGDGESRSAQARQARWCREGDIAQ